MDNANKEIKDKPTITVKSSSYVPTVEEMREDVRIDCSPEELVLAALRPANVVKEK